MKVLNKWEVDKIEVRDPGLRQYINLKPVLVPHSHGRYQKYRFWRGKIHLIDRLAKRLFVAGHRGKKHWRTSGRNTGKTIKAYNIIEKAFDLIEKRIKMNPVEVFVRAIENAAPREEVTTIEYGGVRYPKAVDTSPLRRLDLAIRWIVQGAFQKAAQSKKRIHEALADEIISTANNDQKAYAIMKKIESERQAAASR